MKVKDLTFYLDMDNSMVIFSTRENEEEQLAKMYDKGFYLGLEPAEKLEEVLKVLRDRGASVKVLSGLINSPFVAEEKVEWCKRYGFRDEDIILLPMDKRKCDFVSEVSHRTVLVDDFSRYIEEWRKCGGVAIQVDRKHDGIGSMYRVTRFCDILGAMSTWYELDEEDRKYLFDCYVQLFTSRRII